MTTPHSSRVLSDGPANSTMAFRKITMNAIPWAHIRTGMPMSRKATSAIMTKSALSRTFVTRQNLGAKLRQANTITSAETAKTRYVNFPVRSQLEGGR